MPSRPIAPETVAPDLVLAIEGLVADAKQAEGTAEMGPIAEELGQHYRALAICLLADDAEVDAFFHWLLHSPVLRRHYLATVGSKGTGDAKYVAASHVDPLLDAMAARQWKLAADIARMTSSEWLEGQEYEDDFCYGEFLRRIALQDETGIEAHLARWANSLEGGRDLRLTLARALHSRNADEFRDALLALLAANEERARAMCDPMSGSMLASDAPFYPNRWVSIEGLALVAAAERAGIAVDFEAEGCPRIARTDQYAPFRAFAYPNRNLD